MVHCRNEITRFLSSLSILELLIETEGLSLSKTKHLRSFIFVCDHSWCENASTDVFGVIIHDGSRNMLQRLGTLFFILAKIVS